MKYIAYILTMPNVGSWNGKWSGEGKYYARVRRYRKDSQAKVEVGENYYYNFGDGWVASIQTEEVTSLAAKQIKKNSKGFWGYEWMIDSIENHGTILA